MTIVDAALRTCIVIAVAAFWSAALLPPGDVPKQIAIAALWFAAGALTILSWM